MLIAIVTVFVSLIPTVFCCNPQFPNGTEQSLHWYSCAAQNAKLRVDSLTLFDSNGTEMYPININRGIMVDLLGESLLQGSLNMVYMDATLKYYGQVFGMGRCKWRRIPTMGLTTNLDGCDMAKNCPVVPGPYSFKQILDFGPFAGIIATLGRNTVYEIEMRAKSGDSENREELTCLRVQGLMG